MASSPAHGLASEHAHHAGAQPPVARSYCRPPPPQMISQLPSP
eukprot:CAMPEP_0119327468 /NCGR_PEP_ID=MMETSP1333-20130426/70855_1 /TAXON_ID=418940 /ORGANISM="Scyphosphaera apsteinii, Strain RCC1455" /LENGTH=42 /DNA_ID= /DNA_START= /DNA_END= /DNA_ORIENTATION=